MIKHEELESGFYWGKLKKEGQGQPLGMQILRVGRIGTVEQGHFVASSISHPVGYGECHLVERYFFFEKIDPPYFGDQCDSVCNATPDLRTMSIKRCARDQGHEGSHCLHGFSWQTSQEINA